MPSTRRLVSMISSEGKSPEELARLTMKAFEADQELQAQPSGQAKINDPEMTPPPGDE